MKLRLATRGSKLAWSQSGQVADRLRALGHEVDLVRIVTHGDVSSTPLASMGGAGVFVGAVRAAVLAGEADFAVHSFKDLPTADEPGLALAAVPVREDPADALCARDGLTLAELPAGARVGTGSPRRAAQVLALRPDLQVVEIRGNVETRLARAGADLDAVVLAAAGLGRLGLGTAITERFDPAFFLSAPAQGALAVECRTDDPDVRTALAALDHPSTRLAALAEREVLARLQAGCAAPVGAHASVSGGRLRLDAAVVSVDGRARLTASGESAADPDASVLGAEVAERLLSLGAAAIVDLAVTKPGPLTGRIILLPTRSPAGLRDALIHAGAAVVQVEFTHQENLATDTYVAATTEAPDWLVVTSAATVAALTALPGLGVPASTRVAAVGPATAQALSDAGRPPDLVAVPGGGAALVAAFPDGPGTVLVPGAAEPSEQPAVGLTAKGWRVQSVPVYRTVPSILSEDVVDRWRQGSFDAFVVTAGSVARAAVGAAGVPGPPVIALGASAAEAARAAGLTVSGIATRPDAAAVLHALLAP